MRRETYAQAEDFVGKLMAVDRFEIYVSAPASRYATGAEVRRFAARMIEDRPETGEDLASTLERAARRRARREYLVAAPFWAQGAFDGFHLARRIEAHRGVIRL